MPSRRKRKLWRKRDCPLAEATTEPKNSPRDTISPGALGGEVDEQPKTSLFQSRREFHEDDLLLRRAIREDWPVSLEQRQAIPAALANAVVRPDPEALAADMTGPEWYDLKATHRLAAAELLAEMAQQNAESSQTCQATGPQTMAELIRDYEKSRQAMAGRS